MLTIRLSPTAYSALLSKKSSFVNFVVKFSGLLPTVLTEYDDNTISLSIFEVIFIEFFMMRFIDQ